MWLHLVRRTDQRADEFEQPPYPRFKFIFCIILIDVVFHMLQFRIKSTLKSHCMSKLSPSGHRMILSSEIEAGLCEIFDYERCNFYFLGTGGVTQAG